MSGLPEWVWKARERCEKATAGPWETDESEFPSYGEVLAHEADNAPRLIAKVYDADDMRAIAHARTDLPKALDLIEAQHAELERLRIQASNFGFVRRHDNVGSHYATAWGSGYEAGFRGWKYSDPYTSRGHQTAYRTGFMDGQKACDEALAASTKEGSDESH